MFKPKDKTTKWGNLFAIWIMASNEKQPIMFYRSLMEKLYFKNEEELREMISNNRELFWPMSEAVIKFFKKHYKANHDFCPRWMSDGKTHEEIDATIDLLQSNDAFTCQFRRNVDDPRCSDEIREWGSNYIEKKWNLEVKANEELHRFWGTLIPAISIIATVLVSVLAIIFKKC